MKHMSKLSGGQGGVIINTSSLAGEFTMYLCIAYVVAYLYYLYSEAGIAVFDIYTCIFLHGPKPTFYCTHLFIDRNVAGQMKSCTSLKRVKRAFIWLLL